MTKFIESVSTHQLLPPYHSEGSQVHGFIFEIAPDVIQNYCDTFLNLGDQSERPFLYKPIDAAPFGLLSLTRYPNLCSLDQRTPRSMGVDTKEWDHLSQTEFFVAVPVHRYGVTAANLLTDPVIQWVQPFIIVDNATSAFSGREILGLDTLFGEIEDLPPKRSGGYSFKVSLPSWKKFEPNSAQAMLPFAFVDRGKPLDDAQYEQALRDGMDGTVAKLEAAIPDLAGVAEGRFPQTLELVILKQFRSAADATQAIYQALITCENRYSDVSGMKIYGPGDAYVQFQNGDMVEEILGTFLNLASRYNPGPMLTPVGGGKARLAPKPKVLTREVKLAFSFTATIDLMHMKSVYNFGSPTAAA